MKRSRCSTIVAWIGLLSALGAAQSTQAQDAPIIIENIRVGLAEDFSDQAYKVGTWTPVQIDLQAGPERFQGSLRVIVPDDDGMPTSVVEPVDIPARTTAPVYSYVRPGVSGTEFAVEVYREGRRRPVTSAQSSDPEWLEPSQTIVATMGNPQGVDLLPTLPEFKLDNALQPAMVRLVRMRIPGGIPMKWYGYDGIDVVVLDTNDPQALPALDSFRNLALKEWVRNGGHLVVTIGDRWQVVSDSFLADMLPARPTGQDRTRDTGGIEAFTGSNKAITTPDGPEVALTRMTLVPERSAKSLDASIGGAVLVRGAYGLGRVTVVGLNVDQAPFRDWTDRAQFWVKILDLGDQGSRAMASPTSGAFYNNQMNDLSSYLHRSLEQFEGVTLIPFAWVAFFVFVYILLIGPGDYFFLKKVLKRMELTWITFPLIVLTVSLIAYVTAYSVKGTDLRLNRVDVVDVDQGFGSANGNYLARGTSLSTVFSPQNRDYDLATLPLALNQPTKPEQAAQAEFSDSKPTAVETLTSFFGIAESRFGGMNTGSGGRMGLGSAGYLYTPINGQLIGDPQSIRGVRIPIWTTKSVSSVWFDAVPAVLDADLARVGGNRLEGRITNRLERPLENPIMVFEQQVYMLNRAIEPGETVSINDFSSQNLSGYLERIQREVDTGASYPTDAMRLNVARADLVRGLMFNRAGRSKGLRPSAVLSDLDLTGQLELGRPIFVAEVQGPASTLVLGTSVGKAPKIGQTTVIRSVLPALPE